MLDKHIPSLKRSTAYQLAEETIREKIMDGSLVPGDLLPVEHDLAEKLGVTRPTVREALRKLESAGLIVRGPRRRMVIAAPCPSISANAMHQAFILHDISYRELSELSLALEPATARLAAQKMSDSVSAKIEDNLKRTEISIGEPVEFLEAILEFHYLIASCAANKAILFARAPISEFLLPTYLKMVKDRNQFLVANKAIFEALRRSDAESAHQLMYEHIYNFFQVCELKGVSVDDSIRKLNAKLNNPE
ncbi:GntR family transcriptional regulator [Alteromonas sp. 1_MG-2023]|uniref:FadR/GntR family transcriptional regulator n=1 Tax=Alteromonas sp. 1_MG-2023 TaxID=3062669 RepID=UPI0026E42C9C|nr:GntR family transcriptional regulator [Alteromonas sp. 1_MG-2023]MDO6568911.1 GntR family transcriptional regulator [Alteromonas sp. 1_MG-2023]